MDGTSVEGSPHGYAPLVRSAHGAGVAAFDWLDPTTTAGATCEGATPNPTLRWSLRTVGAAVATFCLAAAGAAVFIERGNMASLDSHVAGEVLRADEVGISAGPAYDIPTPDVLAVLPSGAAVGCASPGEGCQQSQCCIGEGFQCFEKDATWADCMYRCNKDGWSCRELGMRTPLKHAGCAEPADNCALSTCCRAEGHQCYEKDETWASCKLSCSTTSGWSCKEIGERQPFRNPPSCGGFNENCAMSKCCKEEGAQCYALDENFGTCAYACKPGVGWSANWSCDALGERAPLKLGCSWSGQACTATKKCCHEGQQCVKKNDVESYCTHEGPGQGWDGTLVGGARSEFAVQSVPAQEARGTSLFCFMAILPGSSEDALVSTAEAKGASIFACDAHALYHSWKTERTSEGSWNSVVNTEVFVKVWRQVEEDGQYREKDWTVKVDADSVFFPDRLREHLQRLNAPTNFPIYIKNTDVDFGFLGAIEVFSKEAVDKYFEDDNDQHCLTEIGSHSGEDGFMKGCMDMIGAGYFYDVDVLRTPAAKDCTDSARVTFHAFKDVGAWEGCYGAAQR